MPCAARDFRRLFACLICVSIALAASGGAHAAQDVRAAMTGEEIQAALTAAGLSSELSSDRATGAPVLIGALEGGVQFIVRTFECEGRPPACSQLLFFTNFPLDRQVGPEDYRVVNTFNETELFGRAYVIDRRGQVGVDYVLELEGGVTDEHVSLGVRRWRSVISSFADALAGATS